MQKDDLVYLYWEQEGLLQAASGMNYPGNSPGPVALQTYGKSYQLVPPTGRLKSLSINTGHEFESYSVYY